MQFSLASCYFLPLRCKHSPHPAPRSQTPSVYVPPLMWEITFHTHTEPQAKWYSYNHNCLYIRQLNKGTCVLSNNTCVLSNNIIIVISYYSPSTYFSPLDQWFSTGAIWPPRWPCRISEGPQVKVVKLGAMETVKWATKSSPLK
jgi:hypothetical protein